MYLVSVVVVGSSSISSTNSEIMASVASGYWLLEAPRASARRLRRPCSMHMRQTSGGKGKNRETLPRNTNRPPTQPTHQPRLQTKKVTKSLPNRGETLETHPKSASKSRQNPLKAPIKLLAKPTKKTYKTPPGKKKEPQRPLSADFAASAAAAATAPAGAEPSVEPSDKAQALGQGEIWERYGFYQDTQRCHVFWKFFVT